MIERKAPKIKEYELLSQKVYIIIKDRIVKDKYPAGSRIKEKKVAEELRVSITPVREAFRKLATEGFIKKIPNKEGIIRDLSCDDIINSFSIRELLEGLAIRLATPNLKEKDLLKLEFYLKKMKEASTRKDIDSYLSRYTFYQNVILEKSQNNLLKQMINNISELSYYYNVKSLKVEGRFEKSINEHIQIFKALKEGNSRKAEILSRKHIRIVLENIIHHYL